MATLGVRRCGCALGLLIVAFAVARSVYYPFWAAHASHEQLARSWGGPSAFGATAAHWLVAVPIVAVGAGLFLLCRPGRRRAR